MSWISGTELDGLSTGPDARSEQDKQHCLGRILGRARAELLCS
jgi:hypothetical protein